MPTNKAPQQRRDSATPRRWRDIAGPVGRLEPGERNSITDVPGVRVGHSQAESGEPTGITVVAPPQIPAPAATAVVNGMGELTGRIEIDERGTMSTPLYLCGSHAVGIVHHAAVLASGRGPEHIVLPVVGECDDSWRADSRLVTPADVDRALAALGEDVAEGSVGAGTGMMCFNFPGGIGTASRVVGEHRVGVLLLCNFGDREYLDLLGTTLVPPAARPAPPGSCIAVCATDVPMGPHQLRRMALRTLLGLVRVGSYAAEGSGEIGLAFSTGEPATFDNDDLNPYFIAAWEASQEAVYNCLVAARPAPLRDGTMQDAFPVELVRELAAARS
jgi:D-aminopeptidase